MGKEVNCSVCLPGGSQPIGRYQMQMETSSSVEKSKEMSEFFKSQLAPEVLASLAEMGFTDPTPVQKECIPHLLENQRDLIALAKTGTGKTGAFGIPLVQKLKVEAKIQALVLCPTRELANQVASSLQSIGKHKGIKVTAITGGESYRRQMESLKRGPQIVVSTPGRLVDLMDQKMISLSEVQYFVLDEADEMLSFGFKESLETIWKSLSKKGQEDVYTWLFSATMSPSIYSLTSTYLHSPLEIRLNQISEPIRVESFAAVLFEEEKEDALSLAILMEPEFYGIIFAQTKQQVAQLELKLRSFGIEVDSLHGDKVQAERVRTIRRFKSRETQILVATDVAARGLDVEDLTHVVNFELPWDAETYTHRIGRTARAGKTGIVWNLVCPKEAHLLRKFEARLRVQFKQLKIPTRQQLDQFIIEKWMKDLSTMAPFDRELEVLDRVMVAQNMDLSFDVKVWLSKCLKLQKVGAPASLKTPRVLDLHPPKKSFTGSGARSEERSFERRPSRGSRDQEGEFRRRSPRSNSGFNSERSERSESSAGFGGGSGGRPRRNNFEAREAGASGRDSERSFRGGRKPASGRSSDRPSRFDSSSGSDRKRSVRNQDSFRERVKR